MRILRGLQSYPPELRPSVTALGVFDGIHLAHAKILTTAVERARARAIAAVVCTFDPHPATVLRPERAPAPIATLEENLARITVIGPDATLVIPFTLEFSRMEAETFVGEKAAVSPCRIGSSARPAIPIFATFRPITSRRVRGGTEAAPPNGGKRGPRTALNRCANRKSSRRAPSATRSVKGMWSWPGSSWAIPTG